jgi:hypothetical protein
VGVDGGRRGQRCRSLGRRPRQRHLREDVRAWLEALIGPYPWDHVALTRVAELRDPGHAVLAGTRRDRHDDVRRPCEAPRRRPSDGPGGADEVVRPRRTAVVSPGGADVAGHVGRVRCTVLLGGEASTRRDRPWCHDLTAAAGSVPCARYSSSRGRRAGPAAARPRGRAAPDGRPPARRVGRDGAHDASPDSASRGPRRGPRPSASPAAATRTSVGPDGRACAGSGWRSPAGRSGRNGARSSWVSRRRRRGARSLGRRRRVIVACTASADLEERCEVVAPALGHRPTAGGHAAPRAYRDADVARTGMVRIRVIRGILTRPWGVLGLPDRGPSASPHRMPRGRRTRCRST